MTIDLKHTIEFSSVFEESAKDLNYYLTGVSKSKVLLAMSTFLNFSVKNSKFKNYKDFIDMYFQGANQKFAVEVKAKLIKLERPNVEIIFAPILSCLQIFEFAFDHLSDKDILSDPEIEINLFKALLAQNDINTKHDDIARQSCAHLTGSLFDAMFAMTQSYSYSEFVNYVPIEIFYCQLSKSIYLFNFLESTELTKPLLKLFLSTLNCIDWKEYLSKYCPIASAVLKNDKETNISISIPQDARFIENCKFIENLSLSDLSEVTDYDFKTIRGRPIYKESDGRYRIIFCLFVLELCHKGLFFKLSEIHKKLPLEEKVRKKDEALRSYYCDEFSEKVLVYEILGAILGNGLKLTGSETKNYLDDGGEPDYYFRNNNTLFLFESKDILIKAKVKITNDFIQYEEEFKKKLYFDIDKKGNIESKAVLQLINNIKRALKKQFSFDTNYYEGNLSIYPILILHDHSFNVPGLNVLVNEWFAIELKKLSSSGLNILNVKPITIIDIDTFILCYDLIKDKKINLRRFINEYIESKSIGSFSNFILQQTARIRTNPPSILSSFIT